MIRSIRIYLSIAACLVCAAPLKAQNIDRVLRQIEANNMELKTARERANAAKLGVKMQNSLYDPSIEYSPSFAKEVEGVVSSELTVRQDFDFPTVYAARRRAGQVQHETIDQTMNVTRRDILLKAKLLCLEMVRLKQQEQLLEKRETNADTLLVLFEKRLHEGDANILELNKIKMELMSVKAQRLETKTDYQKAIQQLQAMNAGKPLATTDFGYTLMEKIDDYQTLYHEWVIADMEIAEAEAHVRSAEKGLTVSKQQWLPKISIGYKRSKSLDDVNNGFMIGGSIPLFSNRNKVKQMKAEKIGAQLKRDDLRMQMQAQAQAKYNEIVHLEQAMDIYDMQLMERTLGQLGKAVQAGMMPVITYYTEAENIYKNMEAYMNLKARYEQLKAEVYKNRL